MSEGELSDQESRQMLDLIRRYGDEMDQWDNFQVRSPFGTDLFVTISRSPGEASPGAFRDLNHVLGESE